MYKIRSRNRYVFLALALLVLLNYGCSKDIMGPTSEMPDDDKITGFENTTGPMDVALAKRYYERLKIEKGEFVKPGTYRNPSPNYKPNLQNKRYAFFDQAYVSKTRRSTVVEVPIRFDTRTVSVFAKKEGVKPSAEDSKLIIKHSFDRFIVYKVMSTGNIRHWMLTYVPSLDYLKKSNFKVRHNQLGKLDKEFSGHIVYKRWDGTAAHTLIFTNGKRTGYIRPKTAVATQSGE